MNTLKQQFIIATLLASFCGAAMAGDGIRDEYATQGEHSFYDAFGEDEFAKSETSSRAATDGWLFVAGSAFNARSSSQVVEYLNAGCIYTDAAVTTDLQLLDGMKIKGVRTFYYNMGQSGSISTYLTSYDGMGGFIDHLNGDSTLDTGYSQEYYSMVSPITVNNFSNAYVLTALIDSNTRFCGMRVFYENP